MSFINSDRNKNLLSALGTSPFGLESKNPPLQSFLGRPEVKGLYYRQKKLTLDGYTFIGCRFDNCVIDVSSANFELYNCIIDPTTTIQYAPSVIKIIKLFIGRYPWAYEQFPGFVPILNADGTITISERAA